MVKFLKILTMTVIYCNCGDKDTSLLREIWNGVDGAKVVEVNAKNEKDVASRIDQIVSEENDMLILCGHGTSFGLLSPTFSSNIFNKNTLDKVKAKNVVGIWCHASEFAKLNNAKGFYSSMFISNIYEAYANNCFNTKSDEINKATTRFCKRVNKLIKENVPIEVWGCILKAQCDCANEVELFNYKGLMFFD